MENLWLDWAKRLQGIASTGLFFGESDFDKERYEEIHEITKQMLSSLGAVPIQQVTDLFNDAGEGYATPKIDVRAAIIQENKILLVKEKLDGLWTMPGGYADVGTSAANNVSKEVREEANIKVKPLKLFAVVHKAQHNYDLDARDFYKLFFLCRQIDKTVPRPGAETDAACYFTLENLPPLSKGRVIEKHIQLAFTHSLDMSLPTEFD